MRVEDLGQLARGQIAGRVRDVCDYGELLRVCGAAQRR
jgi:hypothetical protein